MSNDSVLQLAIRHNRWWEIVRLLFLFCGFHTAIAFVVPHMPAPAHSVSTDGNGQEPLSALRILYTARRAQSNHDLTENSSSEIACRICGKYFLSRNALFRHLRSSDCGNGDDKIVTSCKQSLAFLFGYHREDCTPTHLARKAGEVLQNCVIDTLCSYCIDEATCTTIETLSHTQSTLARLRPPALEHDADMASTRDILILSLKMPLRTKNILSTDLYQVLTRIQNKIDTSNGRNGVVIFLHAIKLLHEDMPLHAERSSTQLAYQYLLPLNWLKGEKNQPTSDSVRLLKQALRSAESRRVATENGHNDAPAGLRIAHGRFGALAHRERRAWHNYSTVRVSPNHDTAWRVVDRCRIVGFISTPNSDGHPDLEESQCAIIEIRCDALLQGQVRAIVGTALSIANGWIPKNTILDTTCPQYLVSNMPLAPPGRSYLSDVKFHFEELRTGGQSVFESVVGGPCATSKRYGEHTTNIQEKILLALSDPFRRTAENKCLADLETRYAPDVASKLELMKMHEDDSPLPIPTDLPPEYANVCSLLQSIVETDLWPDTSTSRSSIIKGMGQRQKNEKRGSFTIVNPNHPDIERLPELPLGNAKFPQLVEAVYDLEQTLGQQRRVCVGADMHDATTDSLRPMSSHCAVNCDAQFTPHVDSGRGRGQALSMIVGIGPYTGGSLIIEGKPYDIRYAPHEFDGWKLRHWTAAFCGQRFSLVWFTPELD